MNKEIKKNILLLIVSIIIFIVLIEFFMRLFFPQQIYDECYDYVHHPNVVNLTAQTTGIEFTVHPLFGWFPKPNYSGCKYQSDTAKKFYRIHNSKGLRVSREIAYEKPEGKKRMIILGDSYAYGYGLDQNETIAHNMQRLLGDGWDVIPLGVTGYGTDQSLLVLQEEGMRYDPDVVLLFFYQNDFSDILAPAGGYADKPRFQMDFDEENIKLSVEETLNTTPLNITINTSDPTEIVNQIFKINDRKVIEEIVARPGVTVVNLINYPTKGQWWWRYTTADNSSFSDKPLTKFFLGNSHLYSLWYHHKGSLAPKKKIDYFTTGPDTGVILDAAVYSMEREYAGILNYGYMLALLLIHQHQDLANKENFDFVLVNVPSKMNLDESYRKLFLDQFHNVNASFFEFTKVQRLFAEDIPKLGVRYLDLYNVSKERYDEVYFKTEMHWSPEGSEILADHVHEFLKNNTLV